MCDSWNKYLPTYLVHRLLSVICRADHHGQQYLRNYLVFISFVREMHTFVFEWKRPKDLLGVSLSWHYSHKLCTSITCMINLYFVLCVYFIIVRVILWSNCCAFQFHEYSCQVEVTGYGWWAWGGTVYLNWCVSCCYKSYTSTSTMICLLRWIVHNVWWYTCEYFFCKL
jgi:hypothetical protein